MRREPRIRTTRTRRLTGRWLAAVVIVGAVALLAPGISYVTASQSSLAVPAATAATLDAADTGCLGVTPAVFPAMGFITNPARTQGGHLWWRRLADGSVCIGTVVEFVQYNATAAKTWRVIVFTRQNPGGVTVAKRTFTLNRGDYFWGFGVHRVFTGLTAVCLAADESFGMSCVHFS